MMASLSYLNDKQNHLLTQLSYGSNILEIFDCSGRTFDKVYSQLNKKKDLYSENEEFNKLLNTLEELKQTGIDFETFKFKDVSNNPVTGFGAIAFADNDGNTGFSYRGTDGIKLESLNDWLDNIMAGINGTSIQTAEAEAFFEKNKDQSGNNYLYGHSKGGELSESVYVNNYKDIKGMHLLNPQPLNPYTLTSNQHSAMQLEKVDIVINEKDYVWFLGALPSYGNIRIAKGMGKDPHNYVDIKDMYDENNNIQITNQSMEEIIAYIGISSVMFGPQFFGASFGFVYNCIVRVVDDVRDDLIPQAHYFITSTCDRIKNLKNDLQQFASDLKNFLGAVVEKAQSWWNKNLNPGYIYTTSNPIIALDTYKLRTYAQRIQSVNARINRLDDRLDSLYWKVGFLDLWSIMQAALLTGYSWRLTRCVSYLNDTAIDFESIESNLINTL